MSIEILTFLNKVDRFITYLIIIKFSKMLFRSPFLKRVDQESWFILQSRTLSGVEGQPSSQNDNDPIKMIGFFIYYFFQNIFITLISN